MHLQQTQYHAMMHPQALASRQAHVVEGLLLTMVATRSLISSPSPIAVSVLIFHLFVLFYLPSQNFKSQSLRRTTDNVGLSVGTILPLGLLRVLPSTASPFLLCTAMVTLTCGCYRTVSSRTERLSIILCVIVWLMASNGVVWTITCMMIPLLHKQMIFALRRTFTIAEAAWVGCGLAGGMGIAIENGLRGWGTCIRDEETIGRMTVAGIFGAVLTMLVGVGDVAINRKASIGHRGKVLLGGVIGPTYMYGWIFGAGCEPISWTVRYISDDVRRIGTLGIWMIMTGGVVWGGGRWSEMGWSLTMLRKGYHVILIGIVGVGMKWAEGLTGLGLAVGVAGLGILEIGRVCGIGAVERCVEQVGGRLVDEKDRGLVKMTAVYLVVGCAVGVWAGWGSMAGVVAGGFVDGLAAIGGKWFGWKKWGWNEKSIGGTICGIVGGTIGGWIWGLIIDREEWRIWENVSAVLIVGGVEASTRQIDNLILPLVYGAVAM